MASAHEAMIAHVATKMDAIGMEYEQSDAPVISLRDKTKQLLRENLLLPKVRLVSTDMATHPDNRFGDMLVPQDVPALISRIYTQGFSELQLLDPTCSEMPPPGHLRRAYCVEKNRELIEGSGGLLPGYDDYEQIHDMTLTCGHTSQGLRMWINGASIQTDASRSTGNLACGAWRSYNTRITQPRSRALSGTGFIGQWKTAGPGCPS